MEIVPMLLFILAWKFFADVLYLQERLSLSSVLHEIHRLHDRIFFLEKEVKNAVAHIEEIGGENIARISPVRAHEHMSILGITSNSAWDVILASELEELMKNQTVGDFGAGLGCYGRFFLRKDNYTLPDAVVKPDYCFLNDETVKHLLRLPQKIATWKGYDGVRFLSDASGGLVQYVDFSSRIVLAEKFDWVLSLETGEHIPEMFEQVFLDNVANHACKGVVISWSQPKGEGLEYVNSRPNEYIIDQMAKRDFIPMHAWTFHLRKMTKLWRLKNAILVFRREFPLKDPQCSSSEKYQ